MQILIVDDDHDLVEVLSFALRRAGFTTVAAYQPTAVMRILREGQTDLVVLDVNLGVGDGFDLLKEIRQRSAIPVIMLTGRDAEDDKVRGLDMGADDYVSKPFSHRELIARVRARLRTQETSSPPAPAATIMKLGSLSLDTATHTLTKNGRHIRLTVTEFRLLHYMMSNAGVAVPTGSILSHVWGYAGPDTGEVVRVAVHRLRQKIEDDPSAPRLLQTIPGIGFIIKADSETE